MLYFGAKFHFSKSSKVPYEMRVTSRDRSLQIMPPICLHIDLASFQTLFKAESQFSKAKWGNSIFAWVYLGQIIFCILCSLERAKFPLLLQFFFSCKIAHTETATKKWALWSSKWANNRLIIITKLISWLASENNVQEKSNQATVLLVFCRNFHMIMRDYCKQCVRKM